MFWNSRNIWKVHDVNVWEVAKCSEFFTINPVLLFLASKTSQSCTLHYYSSRHSPGARRAYRLGKAAGPRPLTGNYVWRIDEPTRKTVDVNPGPFCFKLSPNTAYFLREHYWAKVAKVIQQSTNLHSTVPGKQRQEYFSFSGSWKRGAAEIPWWGFQ
jgi:hypothetical protein